MPAIVTVTLNPAIDATITLDDLRPGQVHRARTVTLNAGGKGVNVASCLADWGLPVTAAGILGAGNAAAFESLFAAKQIKDAFIRVPGETRTNIKLCHGDTTDINLPGLAIDNATRALFRAGLAAAVAPDALVLLAGSVPAGIEPDIYATLTETLAAGGAKIILDTSGAPLAAALNAPRPPFCIKPNRHELEAFLGHELADEAALVAAGRALCNRGIALVVISMGEQGALFLSETATLRAQGPRVSATSTVGAGDAMVAGIIAALAEGASPERLARLASAFAAGKLGEAGPNLPARETVETMATKITITNLEGFK